MFYVVSTNLLDRLAVYRTDGPAEAMFSAAAKAADPAPGKKGGSGFPYYGGTHGISQLPLWANEDSTVGTWVHALSKSLSATGGHDGIRGVLLVHDASVYPARIYRDNSAAPVAVHMDWCTGQHVRMDRGSDRQRDNSMLLQAAYENLWVEGVPFGRCAGGAHVRSGGGGGEQAQARIRQDHARQLLYHKPNGISQLGTVSEWSAFCSEKGLGPAYE